MVAGASSVASRDSSTAARAIESSRCRLAGLIDVAGRDLDRGVDASCVDAVEQRLERGDLGDLGHGQRARRLAVERGAQLGERRLEAVPGRRP